MAQTIDEQFVENLSWQDPDATLEPFREAVQACSATEVFTDNVRKMRKARHTEADLAITMFIHVAQHLTSLQPDLVSQIMDQFFRDGDKSQFGLANAITATARDTRDPELRWNLEELGGAIAIGAPVRHPLTGAAASPHPDQAAVR
jgi:hypothetical protein